MDTTLDFDSMMADQENSYPPDDLLSCFESLKQKTNNGVKETSSNKDDRSDNKSHSRTPLKSLALTKESTNQQGGTASNKVTSGNVTDTVPSSSSSLSVESRKVQLLQTRLTETQTQLRDLMERFKQQQEEAQAERLSMERRFQEQSVSFQTIKTQELADLQDQYQHEMSRMQEEHETALVKASAVAVTMTEQCRQHLQASKQQISQLQQKLIDTTDDANKRIKELNDSLASQTHRAREMEHKYDAIEAELVEAINEFEDLEEDYNKTIWEMELELASARGQAAEAKAGQLQGQSKIVKAERERDRALEQMMEQEDLLSRLQDETKTQQASIVQMQLELDGVKERERTLQKLLDEAVAKQTTTVTKSSAQNFSKVIDLDNEDAAEKQLDQLLMSPSELEKHVTLKQSPTSAFDVVKKMVLTEESETTKTCSKSNELKTADSNTKSQQSVGSSTKADKKSTRPNAPSSKVPSFLRQTSSSISRRSTATETTGATEVNESPLKPKSSAKDVAKTIRTATKTPARRNGTSIPCTASRVPRTLVQPKTIRRTQALTQDSKPAKSTVEKTGPTSRSGSRESKIVQRAGTGLVKPKSRLSRYGQPGSKLPATGVKGRKSALSTHKEVVSKPSSGHGSNKKQCPSQALQVQLKTNMDTGGETPEVKTSPRILMQNVLKALSPDHPTASNNVPQTPHSPVHSEIESIEATPRENSARKVGAKFDSLFSHWSTAKKPAIGMAQSPEVLPSILPFTLSTTKKTKRSETPVLANIECSTSKRMKKGSECKTPGRPDSSRALVSGAEGLTTVEATPLFIRNELVDVFSPEEMLLSPDAVKQKVALVPSVIALQACYRGAVAKGYFSEMKASAVKIQKTFRGHQLRQFDSQVKRIVTIQRMVRGMLGRRNASSLHKAILKRKRETAATILQAAYRCFRAHGNYLVLMRGIVLLQRSHRLRAQQQALNDAASYIQRSFATVVKRRQFLRAKSSALTLQRLFRGHAERKDFLIRVREVEDKLQTSKRVVMIQACFRGMIVRNTMRSHNNAAVIIQALWRSLRLQRKYSLTTRAASLIQSAFRLFSAQKRRLLWSKEMSAAQILQRRWRLHRKLLKDQASATLIQTSLRGMLARKAMKSKLVRVQNCACTKIQRHYRRMLCQARYSQVREATTLLQKNIRRLRQRQRFLLLKNEVTLIQRTVRMRIAKNTFDSMKNATILLQSWCRRSLARRLLLKNRSSAVSLQSAVRCFNARRKYQSSMHAAIRIQSWCRRLLSQSMLDRNIKAAVIIQSTVRASNCRRLFMATRLGVISVQRILRGYINRTNLKVSTSAAIRIQSIVRGYNCRCLLHQRFTTACKMQALARGANCRRVFQTIRSSLVIIQAFARGCTVRAHIARMNRGAAIVQSQWRLHSARRQRAVAMQAVLLIQRNLRRSLSRDLLRQKSEALKAARRPPVPFRDRALAESNDNDTKGKKRKRAPLGDLGSPSRAPIFSPVRTRRRARKPCDEENSSNRNQNIEGNKSSHSPGHTSEQLEALKVVELRQLLLDLGAEKKQIRNLRKAELVSLATEMSN